MDLRVIEYSPILTKAVDDITAILKFQRDYEKLASEAPCWQDAGAIINEAVSPLEFGDIRFENCISGIRICADPLLGRVFFNIAENALFHGKTTTSFDIRSERRGSELYIIFSDNGTGIAAERKEKVFEFGAGNKSGYGLFLSREILSVTGIEINETGVPGKGARFEIRIPEGKFREIQ
jgi:signal transduction histidine kinase